MCLILVKVDHFCEFRIFLFHADQLYSFVFIITMWKLKETDCFLVRFLEHNAFNYSYKIRTQRAHVVAD
jgi:hypothetical protein